jgi:hypothetical protein
MSTTALSRRAILAEAASVTSTGVTGRNRIGAGCRRGGDAVTTDLTVINGDKIARPTTPKAEAPADAFQSAFMRTSPRYATSSVR